MKPIAQDLAQRRPVWGALSDLFLDTDVSTTRQWRIEELARAPYSLEEIEQILIYEVYPVCKYNLLSVAGEWTYFDLDWLEQRILQSASLRFPLLRAFNLGRWVMSRSAEWRATKAGIALLRDATKQRAA